MIKGKGCDNYTVQAVIAAENDNLSQWSICVYITTLSSTALDQDLAVEGNITPLLLWYFVEFTDMCLEKLGFLKG